MFRIKAEYSEQLQLRTSMERARQFFAELRNFAELMPGVESIRSEAGGVVRWTVSASVPVLGAMRVSFAVVQTEDSSERLEWSPAPSEEQNYLRYSVAFESRGEALTLVRIVQRVEVRRRAARELHFLAGMVGEARISAELQKRITEMVKTFLERARQRLENE